MLPERFWVKVDREGPVPEYAPHLGPCHVWLGALSDGYGQFAIGGGVRRYAHVLRWEEERGPKPQGRELDHLCRVRRCCNPNHLEAVTPSENQRRGMAPERNRVKTHCPKGHPYDEVNTRISRRGDRICRTCEKAHSIARIGAPSRVAKARRATL